MKHKSIKELLPLFLYNDLDDLQNEIVQDHLRECDECKKAVDQLRQINALMSNRTMVDVNDALLNDARRRFRKALADERESGTNILKRFSGFFSKAYRPVLALGLTAMLLFVGYEIGQRNTNSIVSMEKPFETLVVEKVNETESRSKIENIAVIQNSENLENVNISFDAVMPVRLEGSIRDPQVQKLMAYALVESQNPGVRLQSATMIAARTSNNQKTDDEIKSALILALRTDINPGVRKEALQALTHLSYDDQIKQAFMDVLLKDANSGLRIEAINALTRYKEEGHSIDSQTMNKFQQKLNQDKNEYIRHHASLLIGGNQQ